MARALARGWGDPVLCSDGGSGRARELAEELGGEALDSNVEVAERADLVVLCHKPAQLDASRRELAGTPRRSPRCSAASRVATLAARLPRPPVFRLMPNTPVEVRRGVVCYSPGAEVDAAARGARCCALFEPARHGRHELPESLIDAATAVMGVGPAYQALLAEAQVDAAVRHGLHAGARRPAGGRDDGRHRGAARARATTTRWRSGAR